MNAYTYRASVIVCVYNRAKQITACLESLAAQDCGDFEIVVVDDWSTDETVARIQDFSAAHPRHAVTIVKNERNLGVSGARNAGIRAARGEFVAFTDSDCIAEPGWLRALVEAFRTPDIAAVAGRVIDAAPRNLAELAYHGTTRIDRQGAQGRRLVGNNMAFRQEVVAEFLFDEALRYGCDEDELAWRLGSRSHGFAFAPEAIVQHHHRMTFRKFMGMAYRQGQGSARYWYKRNQYIGRDVIFLLLAFLTLPLGFVDVRLLLVSAGFLLLQLVALCYNEIAFKGKRLLAGVAGLPILLSYHAVKAFAVLRVYGRILVGLEKPIRASKAAWRRRARSQPSSAAENGAHAGARP